MGKKVRVVCPDEKLAELSFLSCFEKIEKVDFTNFDFGAYDLFIILDSASPEVVTGNKKIPLPEINKIVIDHHKTTQKFGEINLIDPSRSAAAELLYLLLQDWKVKITKELATSLLTGILGDTGAFEYHNTTPRTLRIAADLMSLGADKDEILLKIFRSKQMGLLKFWGKVLDRLEVDKSGKFTWCAISYETYRKLGEPQTARESASSLFIRMVEGTEFGIVMLEEEPGMLRASFRARSTNFDVSKIALALGGGGHAGAAGVTIVNGSFNDSVKKVVETARKFV
jgi:phosphoesterase RecJ-like protein